MPKLADVARAAGVSTASASRALSGGRVVSAEIRARVEAAAERLGYSPNLSAQALASGPKRIAILPAEPTDPFIGMVVAAVAKALRDRGHGVAIIAPPTAEDEAWLQGGLPHGIIFVGESGRPVQRQLIPSVPQLSMADGGRSGPGLRLELGMAAGVELACRYLTQEGHRRIGVLGASAAVNAGTLSSKIEDAGLSLKDVPADTPARVAVSLRDALHGPASPTALVCRSDTIALAALRYCAVEGIRVPAELSVIGFGDSPVARHSYPALSSIRVSMEAIAVSCANAMSELLSGRALATVAPVTPPLRCVIRESSGARGVSREA